MVRLSEPCAPGRILIVDDNPMNRVIMSQITNGHVVHASESGEAALEVFESFRPDLVLLDIMMDGIDGYETCRRMRELRCGRYTKVIMVSARTSAEERRWGYEAGADDYIARPFNHEELLAKVGLHLTLRRVQEADEIRTQFVKELSAAGMSPLSHISIALEQLADPQADDEDQAVALDAVARTASSVYRLSESVHELCALVTAEAQMAPAPIGARELLDGCVAGFATRAEVRGVAFEVAACEDGEVSCDADWWQRAVRALIEHSLERSGVGDRLRVAQCVRDGAVEITVSDHGCIEHTGHLLDQLEDCGPWGAGKLGLGLAIARRVAWAHGGDLSVEPAEGSAEGVAFVLATGAPEPAAALA